MSRIAIASTLFLSLALGGSALAATTQHATKPAVSAAHVSYSVSDCTSLREQYDAAIKGRAQTMAMKSASKLATQARSSCHAKKYSRGVFKYEAALKKLGVQPRV